MKGSRSLLFRAAAAVSIGGLALVGCSSQTGSDDSQADGKTTLRLSTWYEDKEFKPVLDKVNEMLAKDNITVEVQQVALDQYNTWLSTQLSSGEGPDLVMDGANFPARVKAGNLEDVTGRDAIANYNDAGMALAKSEDGKIYGVPTYGWFSAYFYNKDIFDEHGVSVPTTFDEFLSVSKTLKDAGVTPLAIGLSDSDKGLHSIMGYMENAYYHNGAGSEQVDADFAYGKADLAGNWDESVTQWAKLVDEGVITKESLGVSGDQATNDFLAGKAAMIITGPWDYTSYKDADINFGVFSHVGASADNQYLIGGPAANIGVNAESQNKEAALKAFDAFASSEVQQAFLDANVGAFSYSGATADMPAEYELVQPILDAGNVGNAWDRWGVNMPAQSIVDETQKQLQGVISGTSTPEDFVKALDAFAKTVRYQ